jgi:hypothetical protein
MGVNVVPTAVGGGIKSVQRGLAGGSGDVTITAVDIAKSFVTVFGTTSSGVVGLTGAMNASVNAQPGGNLGRSTNSNSGGANISGSMSGGTNTLVSAVIQGFLANSTTLTVSGACRWEVVEFA